MEKIIEQHDLHVPEVDAEEVYRTLWEYEEQDCRYNERILRAVRSVLGEGFYCRLMEEIRESEGVVGRMSFVREPTGEKESDGEYEVWVDQATNGGITGDNFCGHVYMKLKEGKYLKWFYEM